MCARIESVLEAALCYGHKAADDKVQALSEQAEAILQRARSLATP